MFEGIGAVMPVMNACNDNARQKFPYILAGALATLCTTYILFSQLCYFTWGSNLDQSIVTQELPSSNGYVQVIKILYTLNLVFSYPLTIYPTNIILDSIFLSSFREGTCSRSFLEKLIRTIVLLSAILLAVYLYSHLDIFLAASGTFLGTTVVLLIPSLCHH